MLPAIIPEKAIILHTLEDAGMDMGWNLMDLDGFRHRHLQDLTYDFI